MRAYLVTFVMNLVKNNKEVARSSFIPGRLRIIERAMDKKEITADEVMSELKSEKMKLFSAIKENDWKMIEIEVKKMMKS